MWPGKKVAVEIFGAKDKREIVNMVKALRGYANKKKVKAMKLGKEWFYQTDGQTIFQADGKPAKEERGLLTGGK